MILINENNNKYIIFICSKCGSTSLRELLYTYFKFEKIDINDYKGEQGNYEFSNRNKHYRDFYDHVGPSEGLPLLKDKINLNEYIKVGFIRNHLERLMSVFKFDNLDKNMLEKYDPHYDFKGPRATFNEYLSYIKYNKMYNNTFYNLDNYYLSNDKKLLVDKLYDFNDYINEIKNLFLMFNIILQDKEIPHVNKTDNIKLEYDESLVTESIVYDLFKSSKNDTIIT